MRKLIGLVVAAAVAVFALPAIAAAPKGDKVRGDGWNNPNNPANIAEFHIDVKSGPNGENPMGQVSFKTRANGAMEVSKAINCVNVQGNLATIIVVWTKLEHQETDNPAEGTLINIQVNGKPDHGVSPDQITSSNYQDDVPTVCPAPAPLAGHMLNKGNLKTEDNGAKFD